MSGLTLLILGLCAIILALVLVERVDKWYHSYQLRQWNKQKLREAEREVQRRG